MQKEFLIKNPENFTEVINWVLDQSQSENLVLLLQGDLGVGKTTFTQQLATQLGVTEIVTSPTYTIVKQYPTNHDRFDELVHVDLYRIESEEELQPLRFTDLLKQSRTIMCVEWPERVSQELFTGAIQLAFTIISDEMRRIVVGYV
jgi:tRNA threonylcarbamoyladenosine biosynthesis protein TsaE